MSFHTGKSKDMPVNERLARMTDRSGGPDACWPWLGYRDAQEYGRITIDGKTTRVHVVAYEVFIGPIPDGHFVLHTRECNHKWCVNPAHLYAGTRVENAQDLLATGWKPPSNPNPYRDENNRFTSREKAVYCAG